MVCLDSCFIIDIIKGLKEAVKLEQEIDNSSEDVTITTPVITEIIVGLHLTRTKKYSSQEEKDKVMNLINSLHVLELDKESAILAGEIQAELENKGEIIDIEDIMIGAIAKHNNETLITRNKKHFEKISGLKILSY
ncbi:PIN domain-containing protein [Candidatus Pacearchaeota archaeon]|nr:PIN domain-containing protein [Candidatus Pacearchaeota archaeon]